MQFALNDVCQGRFFFPAGYCSSFDTRIEIFDRNRYEVTAPSKFYFRLALADRQHSGRELVGIKCDRLHAIQKALLNLTEDVFGVVDLLHVEHWQPEILCCRVGVRSLETVEPLRDCLMISISSTLEILVG